MAEYGANYDYGDSPYYKDDATCPECPDENVVITSGATTFAAIIVSV